MVLGRPSAHRYRGPQQPSSAATCSACTTATGGTIWGRSGCWCWASPLLGGGSAKALVVGSYTIEAAAAAAIVVVANRLRPGLVAWWAALVVIGYEWSFGLERLGTVWAPYAVALPAALLVLLVADVAASQHPWPPTIAAAVCASFLCQTEISTLLMVVALALVAPLLRWAVRVPGQAGRRPSSHRPAVVSGQTTWLVERPMVVGGALLGALLVVVWLPPVVQQLTTAWEPGGRLQFLYLTLGAPYVAGFAQSGRHRLRVVPVPGRSAVRQPRCRPRWLVASPIWQRPWYLLYIGVNIGSAIAARLRRQRPAFALAVATAVAMLAAASSLPVIYGPISPYLVFWMGALVVPTLVAGGLALAPAGSSTSTKRASVLTRLGVPARWADAGLPLVSLVTAASVGTAFALGPVPMTGGPSRLGRDAWRAVATAATAPEPGPSTSTSPASAGCPTRPQLPTRR